VPDPHFSASTATTVTLDGRELLAFAGTGYLGLAHHPEVRGAARDALATGGLSAGAARPTSGTFDAHQHLEEALAEWLGCEAALIVADGYLADLCVGQALLGDAQHVLIDADAHPSLWDGARLTRAPILDYGPGDVLRAHALLDRFRGTPLAVFTDGAFPMHARMAAAAELLRHLPGDGLLVVDDSHGLGVLGAHGRGTCNAFGLDDARLVITASLSKALGCAGGVVAGSAGFVERVRRRADAYRGSTPIPAALAAAGCAALRVLEREPARVARLHENTAALHRMAHRLGQPRRGTFLPVLALVPAEGVDRDALQARLWGAGLFAPFVRYPGAPAEGCLRVAVCSEHEPGDLQRLEAALKEERWA
jgi:7-keto-8-aminopelargonate synthetase-like enzyme